MTDVTSRGVVYIDFSWSLNVPTLIRRNGVFGKPSQTKEVEAEALPVFALIHSTASYEKDFQRSGQETQGSAKALDTADPEQRQAQGRGLTDKQRLPR